MKNKKIIATCSLVACMAVAGIACSTVKHFISAGSNEIVVSVAANSDITSALKEAVSKADVRTPIIIPEGTYKISSGIKINRNGVTIRGEGKVVLDGQARITKNSKYKKPSASTRMTSSKYVPEYILSNGDKFKNDDEDCDVFDISASEVTLENIEITGVYKDTYDCVPVGIRISPASHNTRIRSVKIHDMGSVYKQFSDKYNAHGIIVDGESSSKNNTIKGTEIKNCELYNLFLGQSEALVLNGNVEGFEVTGNYVHDCDNIGIDVIGYEHDKSDRDRARGTKDNHGIVAGNVVIGISSGNNTAYRADPDEDGTESRCAGGIYVDGGTYVDIKNNYVEDSDIGIELASEHSGVTTDNINLVNNTLVKNNGLAGLSIGGSGSNNGGTKNCKIENNTIYNTEEVCLNFQRKCYSTNVIKGNVVISAGEAEGYNKDESTAFANELNNNLTNFSLTSLKNDSTNKQKTIKVVSYVNKVGKLDFVVNTDVAIKDKNGDNIFGSSITRKEGDKNKGEEKEAETQKPTEKEEKESESKKNDETKPSVKESEKTSEKDTKKEETTKKKEETTKKETVKETVKETEKTSKETEGSQEDYSDDNGEEELSPEAIISTDSSFYNLEERTKGMRIKYTKKKNKENWKHVDLTFSNLDLTKYSKVKIYVIPSRNGMNLGVTNMDEHDPIFYRNHWETEGKFTSTEEQCVTVDLNEDNIDGLYLYFDATKKDGSSSAQRAYITRIEFE